MDDRWGKKSSNVGQEEEEEDGGGSRKRRGPRTAADVQRSKLEKLMKNPDRPAYIPQPRKERDPNKAPEFVYNVMGSSAGAGSGEFHVYRQIRRKETLRMNVLSAKKEKEDLNDAYHQKLAENERLAEERTAKKRQKRQKKKEAAKKKRQEVKKKGNKGAGDKSESESSQDSDSEKDEKEAGDKE